MSYRFDSSVLKYRFINVDTSEKRIIDNNNPGLPETDKAFEDSYDDSSFDDGYDDYQDDGFPEGFQEGLSADVLSGLTGDMEDGDFSSDGFDENGVTAVIKAQPEMEVPEPEPAGPSYEELMAQVEAEITEMKYMAQKEIDEAKESAKFQGYNEGFEAGKNEGKSAGYNDGMMAAQEEVEAHKAALEAEYEALVNKLEPEFVDTITEVYEHVFGINLESLKGIVMNLALNCIQHVEGSSSYMVHVSPDDYPMVSMQKSKLAEVMGNRNATLDIIEDQMMKKNACLIETDIGVFDCGLDMQLDSLKKQLMLLSFNKG